MGNLIIRSRIILVKQNMEMEKHIEEYMYSYVAFIVAYMLNLPVDPGFNSRKEVARLMSAVYRIWVRCLKTCVHSSGVGKIR